VRPHDKAVDYLIKDRDALLAFTTFLPSTGIICARPTSSKARLQLCVIAPYASKGCLSNRTWLAMIFKLAEAAGKKSWRRLDGHNQLPKVILGVRFADGMEVIRSQHQAAAG
jgi:putative transposase